MNSSLEKVPLLAVRGIVSLGWVITSVTFLDCGFQGNPEPRPAAETAAIDVALRASAGEGILKGEPESVRAAAMTLDEAEDKLTAWGADFPEFIADYPPPDTRVFVVAILGLGVQPGPPGFDRPRGQECLDIRVIVLPDEGRELVLMGKPSEGC